METNLVVLFSGWLGAHFASAGLIFARKKRPVILTILALLLAVYAVKPATYDFPRYSAFFDSGYMPRWSSFHWTGKGFSSDLLTEDELQQAPFSFYERSGPGFSITIKALSSVLPHGPLWPRLIQERHISDTLFLFVLIFGLSLLIATIQSLRTRNTIRQLDWHLSVTSLTICLGSIFVFVGSQNSIRQFLAIALLLCAFSSAVRERWVIATVASALAVSFHLWSGIFLVLLIGMLIARRNPRIFERPLWTRRFTVLDVVGLGMGAGVVIGIKLINSLDLDYSEFLVAFSFYAAKVHQDPEFIDPERTKALTKWVLVGALLLVSEFLRVMTKTSWEVDIPLYRRALFFFATPLIVFPEIFSRVLVFYFAFEMIFVVWAIQSDVFRNRLAGITVFCSYGIAINAINILLDKGWKNAILGIT